MHITSAVSYCLDDVWVYVAHGVSERDRKTKEGTESSVLLFFFFSNLSWGGEYNLQRYGALDIASVEQDNAPLYLKERRVDGPPEKQNKPTLELEHGLSF